ncbi:MAG: CoA-binding protein [Dehalococcoidia bacterium]
MVPLEASHRGVLDYAFYPGQVAVVGASEQPVSFGYHYLRHLIDYGFKGEIYPVNPRKESVLGMKAYPRLVDVPGDVDFVICCVSADRVLPLLDECSAKNVKVMHLFTARLSETGRPQAVEMEKEIHLKAARLGIGLIGPNCMGIYNPEAGISFSYNLPMESGDVGLVFQSGGAATLLIQTAALLGIRFSKAVSYGNGLQIDESDIIDYLVDDPKTKIIAAYFEGIKDGKKFMNSIKRAGQKKPVIAIKGGRGTAGARAVSSHTAAIAGSNSVWETVFNQLGVIQVRDLDEMIDQLTLFTGLPQVRGRRMGIIGGGGGKGVLAADLAEEAGLSVPLLSPEMREQLKAILPAIWDWLSNPIDFSIWGDDAAKAGEVHRLFLESPDFDCIIMQVSDDNPMGDDWWPIVLKMEVDSVIAMYERRIKPVVAVLSSAKPGLDDLDNIRWRTIMEQRSRLTARKVPVFCSIAEAVQALAKFISYWENSK